jgi:hypothetical protein
MNSTAMYMLHTAGTQLLGTGTLFIDLSFMVPY